MAALPRNCWDLQPSLSPWAQTPPLLSRGRSSGWGHGQLCPDLLPPGLLPCEGGRGTHPRIQMRGRQEDLRLGAAPTPAGSRSSEPASHPQTPCPTPQKLFYLRSPRAQAPSTGGSRQGRGHRRHRMTLIDRHRGRMGDTHRGPQAAHKHRQGRPHFCQPRGHMDHCTCSGVGSGGGAGALIIPRAPGSVGLLVGQVDQGQPRVPKPSADFSGRSERRARCCVSVQCCGPGPPLCPPNSGVQTMTHSTPLPPKPSAVST